MGPRHNQEYEVSMFRFPKPRVWARVCRQLHAARPRGLSLHSDPLPKRLILLGAVFLLPSKKQERWEATVAWATRNGLEGIVAAIDPDDYETWDEDTLYDFDE